MVKSLIEQTIPCIYGDLGDFEIIDRIDLRNADTIISTVPDQDDNLFLIEQTRKLNSDAILIVTSDHLDTALEFYDQAIDIGNEIQSWILLSILFNRVALAMMGQKQPKLAKRYFNQAIDLAKQSNANWLIIGPLVNLAQYKLAEGKINEAIDDYHQFVEVATGTGDEQELCYAQLTLAELYKGVGDIPKSKYFLSEGFKLALKLGIFRTISRPEDEANYN